MTVGVAVGPETGPDGRGHFLNALRTTFDEQSDRPAVIFPDRTETGGDLDRLVQVCRPLPGPGVAPGDRVALLTAEKRPFLAAHLGAMYAGAVALPLNPRFTRDELRYFLADSGAVAARRGGRAAAPLVESLRDELPEPARGRRGCTRPSIRPHPGRSYRDPSPGGRRTLPDALQLGDDGRPKGVVHTHANLASSLRALQRLLADHAGRRRGQRPAAVPHPRPLVRHAPEPARPARACGSRSRSTRDGPSTSVGQGTVFMAIPTFYYAFLDRPEFARGGARLGQRPPLHLRLGADPARGAARAWSRSWAGRSSTATA